MPLPAQKTHKLCSSKTLSRLHRHPSRESVQRSSGPSCRRSRAVRSSHFQTVIIHIHALVSEKGVRSKFSAMRAEVCCHGAKRGAIWNGGGAGGGMKSCGCREWKVEYIRSWSGVAPTRSSTDEGGSTFLVDMFYVFVGARVSLRTKGFEERLS